MMPDLSTNELILFNDSISIDSQNSRKQISDWNQYSNCYRFHNFEQESCFGYVQFRINQRLLQQRILQMCGTSALLNDCSCNLRYNFKEFCSIYSVIVKTNSDKN